MPSNDEKDYKAKFYALKQKTELKEMMRELAAESARTAVNELLQKAPPAPPPRPVPQMDPIVHGALSKAHADLRSQEYSMMFSKFTPHR